MSSISFCPSWIADAAARQVQIYKVDRPIGLYLRWVGMGRGVFWRCYLTNAGR